MPNNAELIFDRNVTRTGSTDETGVYSEGGLYVQFERGIEGKPQETEHLRMDQFITGVTVGIYRRLEDADVGAVYPPSEAVFRRPDEVKPLESLRDLRLPVAGTEPDPRR